MYSCNYVLAWVFFKTWLNQCIYGVCVDVTCVLNSSPRLVNKYSYPYAALQLSHTTWYELWLIQFLMSSKIPFRQASCMHTHTHTYIHTYMHTRTHTNAHTEIIALPTKHYAVKNIIAVFILKTYPTGNLVESRVVECWVEINTLNVLHSVCETGKNALISKTCLRAIETTETNIILLLLYININSLVVKNYYYCWKTWWDRTQWECSFRQPAAGVQMLHSWCVSSGQPEVTCIQHDSLGAFKQEPAHRHTSFHTLMYCCQDFLFFSLKKRKKNF